MGIRKNGLKVRETSIYKSRNLIWVLEEDFHHFLQDIYKSRNLIWVLEGTNCIYKPKKMQIAKYATTFLAYIKHGAK